MPFCILITQQSYFIDQDTKETPGLGLKGHSLCPYFVDRRAIKEKQRLLEVSSCPYQTSS